MINHLKPINSNFALGLKMCKKYSKNMVMLHDDRKTSVLIWKSEN